MAVPRTIGLVLLLVELSSAVPTGGDCLSFLEKSEALSAKYPLRIAHGIHFLTLADLRYYFNQNANVTNNIPTINRNLSSSEPILNDAPDLGRSDRFQTMALLVAEEVVLNENRDWDMHNADTLDKLLHALHMHEMWADTSRVYKQILASPPATTDICPCLADVENNGIYFHLRRIALLIREPELGYNTENKRLPRGGRSKDFSYNTGESYYNGHAAKVEAQRILEKRDAQEHTEESVTILADMKGDRRLHAYRVKLFDGFAEMNGSVSTDLALFLFCMLN